METLDEEALNRRKNRDGTTTPIERQRWLLPFSFILNVFFAGMLMYCMILDNIGDVWNTTAQNKIDDAKSEEEVIVEAGDIAVNKKTTNSAYNANIGGTNKPQIRFIFGHSTGHAGSTTVHAMLASRYFDGCSWNHNTVISKFEDRSCLGWFDNDHDCHQTNECLVRNIKEQIKEKEMRFPNTKKKVVYIDMGHVHNYGRTKECLAKILGAESVFVHIRRNRYDIARSASSHYKTMCTGKTTTYCPRSDNKNFSPMDLPVVSDTVWDSFTAFQKYLWLVDEVEHRWYMLKQANYGSNSPKFYEITWFTSEELTKGINEIRNVFGCKSIEEAQNAKKHISHEKKDRACSDEIKQDYQYRRLMNYNKTTQQILVSKKFPQHVDSPECVESPDELRRSIQKYAGFNHMPYKEKEWVLPRNETNNK